jgi:hypothetical protein
VPQSRTFGNALTPGQTEVSVSAKRRTEHDDGVDCGGLVVYLQRTTSQPDRLPKEKWW